MLVKQIQKKYKLSRRDFVKLQIQIWCSLNGISITESILDCLVALAFLGELEMTRFCFLLCKTESSWFLQQIKEGFDEKDIKYKYIFSSEQSARNSVTKAISLGLISRQYKKHQIKLNPKLEVFIESGTLLNLQILCYEANQGKDTDS